jgi:hypothetical protein
LAITKHTISDDSKSQDVPKPSPAGCSSAGDAFFRRGSALRIAKHSFLSKPWKRLMKALISIPQPTSVVNPIATKRGTKE